MHWGWLITLFVSVVVGQTNTSCDGAFATPTCTIADLPTANCLQTSGLCSRTGNVITCDLKNIAYTWFVAPAKCKVVSSAKVCVTPSNACTSTLSTVLDTYECSLSRAQNLNVACLCMVFIFIIIILALRCCARCARRMKNRPLAQNWLQRVDMVIRKWMNLVWRILKLKSRQPLSLIVEQLLPLILSMFLIIVVNLKPLEQFLLSANFSIYQLRMDFGDVNPSSLTLTIMQRLSTLLPLFFVLCYCKFVSSLTGDLVRDKESRVAEVLKIMGTSNLMMHGAWILTWMLIGIPLALLMGLSLSIGRVFPNSDAGALCLFFYAFFLSIIAFAQVCAPFFWQSKTASWISVLVWMLFHVLAYGVLGDPLASQRQNAVLPQTAFTLGISRMTRESLVPGIGGLCEGGVASSVIEVYECTGYLVLNTVVTLIIAWYLDKVVPQQYGTSEKWYFLFVKSYWFGEERGRGGWFNGRFDNQSKKLRNSVWADRIGQAAKRGRSVANLVLGYQDYEQENKHPVEIEMKDGFDPSNGVNCVGLSKTYQLGRGEVRVAVDNLNLFLARDQVTALLGHNGAGKSTTIGMLIGMIRPSKGTATVFGKDLSDINHLRQKMGVCLQHDVLFDRLTVIDHLRFFAVQKGVLPEKVEEAVNYMISEVGLTEKKNEQVQGLSGGQKRKLSLAIALVGGSEVVFLDEPTSGMDPHSRRSTWNVIRRHRAGRVIVLTTHFMDEADILGDTVAIMSDGQLKCAGSSLFLKNKYGSGYSLSMTKNPGHGDDQLQTSQILSVVSNQIPGCSVQSSIGTQLTITLAGSQSAQFPALLRTLDQEQKTLGISDIGMSVTTLEDVFLKIASNNDHYDADRKVALGGAKAEGGQCGRQCCGLLLKRWRYGKRDRLGLGLGILLPVIFLLSLLSVSPIDFVVLKLFSGYQVPGSEADALYSSCTRFNTATCPNTNVPASPTLFPQCYGASSTCSCTLNAPCMCTNGCNSGSVVNQPCQSSLCFGCNPPNGVNCTIRTRYPTPSTSQLGCYTRACMSPVDFRFQATANVFLGCLVITLAMCFLPVAMVVYVVKEQEATQNSRLQQYISGAKPIAYWASLFTYDSILAIIPALVAPAVFISFANFGGGVLLDSSQRGAIYLTSVVYTFCHIPITYALSFRYDHHSKAQTGLLVFGVLSGPLLAICAEILKIIQFYPSGLSLAHLSTSLYKIALLKLGPPLGTTGDGVFDTDNSDINMPYYCGGTNDCYTTPSATCCTPPVLGFYMVGRNLLYLVVEAILAMVLIAILEARQRGSGRISSAIAPAPPDEDEDVAAERRRVNSGDSAKKGDSIIIKNLHQKYKNGKVALKSLCLGVGDECFGYLGINGAGKTTTMKILTGYVHPTSGSATLGGYDAISQQSQARRIIGYCPQFDALLDLLTVREHLELFADLKGIRREDKKKEVDGFIERMDLQRFANKLTQTLSGGNKRKLSAALALMGRPRVVFLDEPSTGMDPAARRFMWGVIREVAASGCSVILTTHSMEECEALCAKIGMLVDGQLLCLGSAQHLKARFGRGYSVEAKIAAPSPQTVAASTQMLKSSGISTITPANLKDACSHLGREEWSKRIDKDHPAGWLLAHQLAADGSIAVDALTLWWVQEEAHEALISHLSAIFTQVVLVERHGLHLGLNISTSERLASVFEILESCKRTHGLCEYSVSQTTLEEIFNSFAERGAFSPARDALLARGHSRRRSLFRGVDREGGNVAREFKDDAPPPYVAPPPGAAPAYGAWQDPNAQAWVQPPAQQQWDQQQQWQQQQYQQQPQQYQQQPQQYQAQNQWQQPAAEVYPEAQQQPAQAQRRSMAPVDPYQHEDIEG